MKLTFSNIYLFETITFNNISFNHTIRTATQSGFSAFVDFVRINKISQDNHYI